MFRPVEVVAEVASTNRVLLERARSGAPHGSVLVAGHQTAGRGRLGRSWLAAPGASLLVSVLVRPDLAPADLHLVTAVAGLAAVDMVSGMGVEAGLKWPNDVVVGDDKLAGLLSESLVERDRVTAVVVGMGMNLRDVDLPPGGVALDTLVGHEVERDERLATWLEHLAQRYEILVAPGGADATIDAMRGACVTLGRRVQVELPGGFIVGTAVDLGPTGALVVLDDEGERHEVLAGDVVHLRPAPG